MARESTVPVSLRVPVRLHNALSSLPGTLTDNIIEMIEREVENVDFITREIRLAEEKIEFYKNREKMILQKQKDKSQIPRQELAFLLETNDILKMNPQFADGRLQAYLNKFRKTYTISKAEFFTLLVEAENQYKEKQIIQNKVEVKKADEILDKIPEELISKLQNSPKSPSPLTLKEMMNRYKVKATDILNAWKKIHVTNNRPLEVAS